MKKKLITVLMAGVLAASLAGCSGGELSNEYVTVKQYKGIEVPQVLPEDITDDDIDSEIQLRLQMTVKQETVTDRAAEEGDMVNIDFKGSIDGEEFSGGSAQGYDLQLGSGLMIGPTDDYKGFEEQIVGHKTGDEFDIQVQFPEEYTEDLSGKVADFHIVLNEIYTSEVPELTDEWVQENSDKSDTVDEYKEEIRDYCVDQQLATEMQDAFLAQVEAKKYPEGEVEDQISEGEAYYNQYAVSAGLDLDTFIENYMGMSREDFDAQMKESAQNVVKMKEAVKLLADKLDLEPTEEEYQKAMARYAAMAGTTDVEGYTESVGEDLLKDVIRQDAVMQYLVDQCVQVEQTDTTTEDTGSDSSTSNDSGTSDDSSTSDDGSTSDGSSTSDNSSSDDGSAQDTGSENTGE